MSRRIILIAIFFAMSVGDSEPGRGQGNSFFLEAPYSAASEERPAPLFDGTIDSVAAVIGLPPLREMKLPSSHRELRIWNGFGIAGPFGFLRIIKSDSGVAGEMSKWSEYAPVDSAGAKGEAEGMRRHYHCTPLIVRSGYQVCPVQFPDGADWRVVLEKLEEHRVWSLPYQQDVWGEDGFTIVVETLIGEKYRTYDYWTTDDEDPKEQDANAIENLVFGTLDEEFGRKEEP